MLITIPLGGLPRIVQAGLSLHGHLRKEQFLMHDVWGLHVYFYSGKLRFQREEFTISSGMVSVTPPNVPLEWEFPDHAPHYYVHFIPSESCMFDDGTHMVSRFNQKFPVMNGPYEHFDSIVRDMELIGSSYQQKPLKAQVCLWNLLWKISDTTVYTEEMPDSLPSSVQITMSYINQHYCTAIVIEDLAKHSGVSHNYLTRLFKEHLGCTIEAYIRQKRCQQAQFLLLHSSLAIKSIAQAVGIPDINHFNKTIKKELGAAPSHIRYSTSGRQKETAIRKDR